VRVVAVGRRNRAQEYGREMSRQKSEEGSAASSGSLLNMNPPTRIDSLPISAAFAHRTAAIPNIIQIPLVRVVRKSV
jgi:hypothetical protein